MPRKSADKSSKRKGRKHGSNANDENHLKRRKKCHLDGLKVPSKKICRGRLTVGNVNTLPAQGGIYLKGVRSQFTERISLNDENTARRDEDLCRLIDYGLPQLRKEGGNEGNLLQRELFNRDSSRRDTVGIISGEEIDRIADGKECCFSLLRSPDAPSPGFRLPQHHFQHSALRECNSPKFTGDKSLGDLFNVVSPSPEKSELLATPFNPLLSIQEPSNLFNRDDFCQRDAPASPTRRQTFVPFDHSTPITLPSTSLAVDTHEYTIEDGYLHFQQQLDRVLHDVTGIIALENDLDDRQQLCEYYAKRLRSLNGNCFEQAYSNH